MVRRTPPTPTDDPAEMDPTPSAGAPAVRPSEPDLATLPIIGITRRRAATLLGVLVAGWIVIVFARQVSDASAATGRAEGMIASNAQRTAEVAGLERELDRSATALHPAAGARLRPGRLARDLVQPGRRRAVTVARRARFGCRPARRADLRSAAGALAEPAVRPDRLTQAGPAAATIAGPIRRRHRGSGGDR